MEFDPENVKLLCMQHHLYWWHTKPKEARAWLRTVLSADRLDRLKARAQTTDRSLFDYKLYKLSLEIELKKLERAYVYKA